MTVQASEILLGKIGAAFGCEFCHKAFSKREKERPFSPSHYDQAMSGTIVIHSGRNAAKPYSTSIRMMS